MLAVDKQCHYDDDHFLENATAAGADDDDGDDAVNTKQAYR